MHSSNRPTPQISVIGDSLWFMNILKFLLIFMCYFLCKSHSTEQIPFTRVFLFGTHFTAESTEAMRIMCLAQGHDILMQSWCEPSIAVSRRPTSY